MPTFKSFEDPSGETPAPPDEGEHVWLWRHTDGYDEHWGTVHAPTALEARAKVWPLLVEHCLAAAVDDGKLCSWPSGPFMIAGGYL